MWELYTRGNNIREAAGPEAIWGSLLRGKRNLSERSAALLTQRYNIERYLTSNYLISVYSKFLGKNSAESLKEMRSTNESVFNYVEARRLSRRRSQSNFRIPCLIGGLLIRLNPAKHALTQIATCYQRRLSLVEASIFAAEKFRRHLNAAVSASPSPPFHREFNSP